MIPALGLVAGIVLGLVLQPDVPVWLQPYLPIAVIAALLLIARERIEYISGWDPYPFL